MGSLRFLSRLALICNSCFILLAFSQYWPKMTPWLENDIVLLGWMGALTVNIAVNCVLLILLLIGRLRRTGIPAWLLLVNFGFFAVQLTLLYINRNLR